MWDDAASIRTLPMGNSATVIYPIVPRVEAPQLEADDATNQQVGDSTMKRRLINAAPSLLLVGSLVLSGVLTSKIADADASFSPVNCIPYSSSYSVTYTSSGRLSGGNSSNNWFHCPIDTVDASASDVTSVTVIIEDNSASSQACVYACRSALAGNAGACSAIECSGVSYTGYAGLTPSVDELSGGAWGGEAAYITGYLTSSQRLEKYAVGY